MLKELGRGAMGVVYAAEDPFIGRAVAIKTIRFGTPEAGDDREQLIQRLRREAQAAGVLSHPGIVTVYDIGEQEDEAYIVMEFVDGESVEQIFGSGATEPIDTYISILMGSAVALDYAHGKGIIHRDVKPSNIIRCRDGTVKIADFGIAKLTASNSLTQAGFVVGTPSYMSPEQAQGRPVDGRSDQFSLAVVAFRMLTGKLPFEEPTLTALLAKILWEEPEYENAGISPTIQPVLKKALSKDPKLRYPSCRDFVRELEEAYGRSKSESFNAIHSTQKAAAPAVSKTVFPGSSLADGEPKPLDAAELVKQGTPLPASWAAPSRETPGTGEHKENSLPSSSVIPETAAQTPRRKSKWIVWAASVGIVALAVIVFFVIRETKTPDASVQKESADSIAASKSRSTDIVPSADPLGQAANQERTVTPPSSEAQSDLEKIVSAEISASKPKQADASASPPSPISGVSAGSGERKKAAMPIIAEQTLPKASTSGPKRVEMPASQPEATSGVLEWSGELQRNSILVITEQGSSIGSLAGQLPGKPIKIELEPKSLTIRQMPGKTNQWKQIILYSGNQKYSSITIRWKIVE